jgi:hypothetical protein
LVEEEKRKASLGKKKKKGDYSLDLLQIERTQRRMKWATYIGIFCIVTRDV